MNGTLTDMLLDRNPSCSSCWNREGQGLLDDHRSGRQDHHKLLFSLAMVEQWLRESRSPQLQPVYASPH